MKNVDGFSQGSNTISAVDDTGDPQVYLMNISGSHSLECLDYHQLAVCMKVDTGGTGYVQIFWGTSLGNGFSSERTQAKPMIDNGEYNTYIFDIGAGESWNGVLDDIRIDPFGGTTNIGKRFWLDYVRLIP